VLATVDLLNSAIKSALTTVKRMCEVALDEKLLHRTRLLSSPTTCRSCWLPTTEENYSETTFLQPVARISWNGPFGKLSKR
jgi:hypothetical protein